MILCLMTAHLIYEYSIVRFKFNFCCHDITITFFSVLTCELDLQPPHRSLSLSEYSRELFVAMTSQ